jgi:ribA/ribD-fused uncharacterized protein
MTEATELAEETAVEQPAAVNAAIDATRAAIDKVSRLDVVPGADGGAEDAVADNEEEGQPARNEVGAAPETEAAAGPAGPVGPAIIEFYSKTPQYKEFGNYFLVKLMIDGKMYPSVEHYYQAMKFPDNPEYQETIRLAKTPALAKRLGKTKDIAERKDWSAYKDTVMTRALREKFSANHPELKKKLLETGDAILRDGSPMDNYWGIGRTKKGRNRLGQILMEIRDELRKAETAAAAAAVRGASGGGLGIDALLTRPAVDAANAAVATAAAAAAQPAVVIQMGAAAAPAAPVVPAVPAAPALKPIPENNEEAEEEENNAAAPAAAVQQNPNPPQLKILDLTEATAQPMPAEPQYKTINITPFQAAKE